MSIKQDETGALSHLVEAATALARLTHPPASAPPSSPDRATVISDEESNPSGHADALGSSHSGTKSTYSGKREIFPQRLLAILNDDSLSDVITWLPHGRSFVIVRPDVFTEKVLPKYLPPVDARASTKYPSFTRKLNRWGFRQATRGPDTGAFHHPLFRRDSPEACLGMVCQRSRDKKSEQLKVNSDKSLPLKKRASVEGFAPLTKESLDSMLPKQSSVAFEESRTVSVDDNRSIASTANSSQIVGAGAVRNSSAAATLKTGVCNNAEIVQEALRRRDEEERLKVAKAMLYQSFLSAMQGK